MKYTILENYVEFVRNGANIKQLKTCNTGIPITRIETLSNGIFNFDKLGYAKLLKMFLAEDANTIIRRPNCRKFCLDNDIFMEIHEKAWLIDIENFMKKVNPKSMNEHYEVPRLRNLRYCVNSWNKRYKRWQIDKHDIEYLIKNGKIFSFKHGNRWVLNYDEVLNELKIYVKTYKGHPNAKKKRKK